MDGGNFFRLRRAAIEYEFNGEPVELRYEMFADGTIVVTDTGAEWFDTTRDEDVAMARFFEMLMSRVGLVAGDDAAKELRDSTDDVVWGRGEQK